MIGRLILPSNVVNKEQFYLKNYLLSIFTINILSKLKSYKPIKLKHIFLRFRIGKLIK